MTLKLPRTLAAVAISLAVGSVAFAATPPANSSPQAAARKAQAVRVEKGQAHLLSLRSDAGLGSDTGFVEKSSLTNPQGRTVARFDQTYQGHRVFGGEAIVHVEATGTLGAITRGTKPGIALATSPRLTAEQATAIALRNLAAKGPMTHAPKVELVVFPSRYTGGFVTKIDARTGRQVLDLDLSTWAKAPASSYVWAYEIHTLLRNRLDGHKEVNFIVDADTGAVLRKWSGIQGDTPVANAGKSFYRGDVTVSASQAGDGTYSLVAQDRGSLPQPYAAAQGITQLGMATYYGFVDYSTGWGWLGAEIYAGNTTGTWGDGTRYPFPFNWTTYEPIMEFSSDGMAAWFKGARDPSGETTAVDAHWGVCTTWDFYKQVFGRQGIDGLDTSTLAIVHDFNPINGSVFADNAYWSSWMFGMSYGDGSYSIPESPDGLLSLPELDVTAHEVSHGVMATTAGLVYEGQSGGLNEGNSDFFGKMTQAWSEGGDLAATTIPDFPADDLTKWMIGYKSVAPGNAPFRYMHKPSLDGISADQLFDGIDGLDVHYSSGVLNRAMFFLTTGASSNPASETWSPILPGGMAGIGNDRTARIWYKAVTEHLLPDATFADARAAMITSAQELYPESPEVEAAVWKAWAAVNVGPSGPGETPRVWVHWPVTNPEGGFFSQNASNPAKWTQVQFYPTHTRAKLAVEVSNTTNQAVTFEMGSLMETWQAGHVAADGTWITPSASYYGDLIRIRATSHAAPEQFAMGSMFLIDIDADLDTEIDVFDLGYVAMNWGLDTLHMPKYTANIAGSYEKVDDWSVEVFNQAFSNAFRQ